MMDVIVEITETCSNAFYVSEKQGMTDPENRPKKV